MCTTQNVEIFCMEPFLYIICNINTGSFYKTFSLTLFLLNFHRSNLSPFHLACIEKQVVHRDKLMLSPKH